jgi:hypothetical protein
MDYVWAITVMTSANIATETNVIINVQWRLTGTDAEGNQGVFNGATPLAVGDIDPATFVPYDQLTQELVLSWVQPIVENNKEYWLHINKQIEKQIIAIKEQVNLDIPLPWNPTPTPTPPPEPPTPTPPPEPTPPSPIPA